MAFLCPSFLYPLQGVWANVPPFGIYLLERLSMHQDFLIRCSSASTAAVSVGMYTTILKCELVELQNVVQL